MRLTPQERKVLSAISAVGAASVPQLAKIAKLRQHSVRHALDRLLARQVIRLFPAINACPLGYTAFSMYFSLSTPAPEKREAAIEWLVNHPATSWVAEFAGDYQYAITMFASRTDDFQEFLEEFSSNAVFSRKSLRTDLLLEYYPLKYFGDGKKQTAVLCWGPIGKQVVVDSLDRKILSNLASGAFRTHAALARDLSVPLSTLEFRITKLTREGVITGYSYFLNSEKAGLNTFKIHLYARGLKKAFSEKLSQFCRLHPNVSLFLRCAGSWDYELNIILDGSQSILSFTQDLSSHFGDSITDMRTMELVRHIKVKDFPFGE